MIWLLQFCPPGSRIILDSQVEAEIYKTIRARLYKIVKTGANLYKTVDSPHDVVRINL